MGRTFSFLPSTIRNGFSYSDYQSVEEAPAFTEWTCSSFSSEPPQTYERESPSPNSFRTRFSEPFVPWMRIGGPDPDIFRDPNGFNPRINPFKNGREEPWAGGKNQPGFIYDTESFISNRGIDSIFGSAFIRNEVSYSPLSLGPVIPLCSASMPTIVSSDASSLVIGGATGLLLLLPLAILL